MSASGVTSAVAITAADLPLGETLLYLNSVDNVAFAINWGNFAETYVIGSGPEWRVELTKKR